MVTETDIKAGQSALLNKPFTYDKTRNFAAGNVKIKLRDVKIDVSDGVGGRVEVTWDYVDIPFGAFKRAGANSILVGSKVIRRYWGEPLDYVTIATVPAGTYSLQIEVEGVYRNGNEIMSGDNSARTPWVALLFDLYHH